MSYERRRRLGAAVRMTVAAVEDAVQAGLVQAFGVFGHREITVQPFIGYGTPERVRALGRVVLGRAPGRPAAAELVDEPAGFQAPPRHRWDPWRERWRRFREGVAPFLTVEVPGCPVVLRGPVDGTAVRTDRQG